MRKPVIFMYSGQGAQYFQMGKELYNDSPVFKEGMERCAAVVDPLIGASLLDAIYSKQKAEPFKTTHFTHPAVVAIAYSLTQLLYDKGLKPDYLLGYSLGEYTAAIVSGVIGFEAGIEAVARQALLLQEHTPQASMIAILEDAKIMERQPKLFAGTTLACRNFRNHFVVTGCHADLERIEAGMVDQDVVVQMLPVSQGFHSAIIDPIEASCLTLMEDWTGTPQIPVYSSMTKALVSQFTSKHLWQVIRMPVLFQDSVQVVERQLQPCYVDVGPAGTLATFIKYGLGPQVGKRAHASMNPFGRDLKCLDNLMKALNLKSATAD